MKSMMLKLAAVVFIGLLSIQMAGAGTSVSGKQTKGSAGQNAKLECAPVTIKTTMKIAGVSGSNAGFWIVKDGATVMKFHKENDPSAVGKSLPAGTYHVYPNLKGSSKTATVTVTLK
jgi:hypothetical protein